MLKHVSHFFLQIFPSVIATVVGAYIVNYYILPKSQDAPPKAAIASTPDPAKDSGPADGAAIEPAAEASAKARASTDKPPAEKASADKPASEKPAVETKRSKLSVKTAAPSEKPVTTVSIAPANVPLGAEDQRDANDIARAALDRLRVPAETPRKEAAPNQPQPQRAQDQPRVTVASTPPQPQIPAQPQILTQPQVQQQMQPLPPAVLVTAPSSTGSLPQPQPPSAEAQVLKREHLRLTPPAEIPGAAPLDLHATGRQTSIADDMMSKAKSVFEAVIPR